MLLFFVTLLKHLSQENPPTKGDGDKNENVHQRSHTLADTLEVFANTRGRSVKNDVKNGSTLIGEIYKNFGEYASNSKNCEELKPTKLLDLFHGIQRSVKSKKSNPNDPDAIIEIVELQDRLQGKDIFILPKKWIITHD